MNPTQALAVGRRPRHAGEAQPASAVVRPRIHRVVVGPKASPLAAARLGVKRESQASSFDATLPTVVNGVAYGCAQGMQVLTVRMLAGLVRCALKLPPSALQHHFGWAGEVVRSGTCLSMGAAVPAGVARPWAPRECGKLPVATMVASLGVASSMCVLPELMMRVSGSATLGMKLALNGLTRPVVATLTELGRRANPLGVQLQLVVPEHADPALARIPAERLGQLLDKPRLAIAFLSCFMIIWMHGQLGRECETSLLAQAPDLAEPDGVGHYVGLELQGELTAALVEGMFELAFAFAATWQALRNGLGLRLANDDRPSFSRSDPASATGARTRARMVAGWLAGEYSVMLAQFLGAPGHMLTRVVQQAVYALCALHGYVGQRASMAQVGREAPPQPAGTREFVAVLDGGAGWRLRAAPPVQDPASQRGRL